MALSCSVSAVDGSDEFIGTILGRLSATPIAGSQCFRFGDKFVDGLFGTTSQNLSPDFVYSRRLLALKTAGRLVFHFCDMALPMFCCSIQLMISLEVCPLVCSSARRIAFSIVLGVPAPLSALPSARVGVSI